MLKIWTGAFKLYLQGFNYWGSWQAMTSANFACAADQRSFLLEKRGPCGERECCQCWHMLTTSNWLAAWTCPHSRPTQSAPPTGSQQCELEVQNTFQSKTKHLKWIGLKFGSRQMWQWKDGHKPMEFGMPYFQTIHLTLTIQERSKRKNSCCVVFFCVWTSAHVASTLGMAREICGFVPRFEGFHGECIQGHGQMRGPLLPAGCLVWSVQCYRASQYPAVSFSMCKLIQIYVDHDRAPHCERQLFLRIFNELVMKKREQKMTE